MLKSKFEKRPRSRFSLPCNYKVSSDIVQVYLVIQNPKKCVIKDELAGHAKDPMLEP
jgi:hypothetical protein